MQCSDASGEVIKCRQKGEVALIAPEQDVSQVPEAVNGLLDRGELPCGWTMSMFHLSVVLEKGDIVGGGLQTQHESRLVIHFYGGLAVVMLDACTFDAG